MKKTISLLLVVIAVFSLCSCGNSFNGNDVNMNDSVDNYADINKDAENGLSKNKQLTARNITELCDSDGYLYNIFDGGFGVFCLTNGINAPFKVARLNNELEINYSQLANSSDWHYDAYNDTHISIGGDSWGSDNYTLVYSDPDGEYVIFVKDRDKDKEEFDIWGDNIIFLSKDLMQSFFNKMNSSAGRQNLAAYPSTVEGCAAMLDSCK